MVRNLAFSCLAVVVAAIAFFAGRVTAPSPGSANPTPTPPSISSASMPELERFDASIPRDPHTELLQALELPPAERRLAIHRAMNAWLAEEGAAAVRTARDDPRLVEVVDVMMQVAMVVDPDIFIEDPSLLEGFGEGGQLLASRAEEVAVLSRDLLRQALLDHQIDAGMGFGEFPPALDGQPLTLEDAYAEVESILADRRPMERWQRLHGVVYQMAASDLSAAAALVETLPASAKQHAASALIAYWAQSDPSAAAHWLSNQGDQSSQGHFAQLAHQWGMRDFHNANGFAAILSGAQRRDFLEGLANAAHNLPSSEKLAWIGNLEGDPDYPSLATIVAQDIAYDDLGAALSLIGPLPPTERSNAYGSFLPTMAAQDPEGAMATIEAIGDPSQRDQALAAITFGLAFVDPQQAIEAIDQIEDPKTRHVPVMMVLGQLEDENEAIRLGREHGFDRQAVVEMRANSSRERITAAPFVFSSDGAIGFGPRSFAAPSMIMLDDGRGSSGMADGQTDEDR